MLSYSYGGPIQTIPSMAVLAQVDALGLITGSASPSECVRAPASCAVVEGTYALDARHSGAVRTLLEACGLPGRALPVTGRPCSIIVRREVRVIVSALHDPNYKPGPNLLCPLIN